MHKYFVALAIGIAPVASAQAQDTMSQPSTSADQNTGSSTMPQSDGMSDRRSMRERGDGPRRIFGVEPYFGVMGGYHDFDNDPDPSSRIQGSTEGALVGGILGFNFPLGPIVLGVEGNGAKGFGDIDWEYGVSGLVGFRAGESGQIFARAGYQWIEAKQRRFPLETVDRQGEDVLYGIGFEVGPADIGIGLAGTRFRVNIDTLGFDSLRTTAGILFHF